MTRFLVLAAVAAVMTYAQPAKASTLSVAEKYIGMNERKHRKALRAMIGVDPARVPWCGAAMAFFVKKAGKKPPRGANLARSWLTYGKRVKLSQIKPGDVVVVRSVRNHVGVFKRTVAGKICIVSGNSRNAIREACHSRSRVLGVRR